MIRGRNIENGTITADKMAAGVIEGSTVANNVTVDAGETVGTATVVTGSTLVGFIPTAQDQIIESIAISGTTLTVTLAAAATANNTFVIQTI